MQCEPKIWDAKQPNAVMDYSFDWTPAGLIGELTSVDCVLVSGDVVIESFGIAEGGTAMTVWLGGGTEGTLCQFTLNATTATQVLPTYTAYITIGGCC